MMTSTSIEDIPGDVLQTSLFPLLRCNDLLRLRRVCTWTKNLSDDYLRLHPISRSVQGISMLNQEDKRIDDPTLYYGLRTANFREVEDPTPSLETFLLEDKLSSIQKPVSRFKLEFKTSHIFSYPLIQEFLRKYGNQVRQLEVSRITFPFSEAESQFYQQLPKLKSLTVRAFDGFPGNMLDGNGTEIPAIFAQLEKLHIPPAYNNFHLCAIESFKKLQHFGFTELFNIFIPGHFEKFADILERNEHTSFCEYDMYAHKPIVWDSQDALHLWRMCVMSSVKLLNVDSEILLKFEKSLLVQIVPNILSLECSFKNGGILGLEGLIFPNVSRIKINFLLEFGSNENWSCCSDSPSDRTAMRIRQCLAPGKFPCLRTLELAISTMSTFGYSWIITIITSCFPDLEELKFFNCLPLDDVAFTGENGERPLLQLKKLKKLDLGLLDPWGMVTDVAFLEVFRYLRVEEFRMESRIPLVSVTRDGIRGLLTGPFRESIKHFPFDGWSLSDMEKEHFDKLAREFPNNQNY